MNNLKRQASHDILTGLLNHTYAKEQIQTKINCNPNGAYILAIIDIDQFKAVNDSYGHMFGDQVLKHMAEKLRQNTCHEDIIARVGGDEFLLFLECKTDAEQVVSRIFNAITEHYKGVLLSISIGISRTNMVGGDEYDKLFHAADQALYAAKRAGRRQYRFYDDSISETLSVISPLDQNAKGEGCK